MGGTTPSDDAHTIVVAIDGLRASALGAYGVTAHATPTFDRFVAESTLFEWAYADTPDYADFYHRLAERETVPSVSSLLVTDTEKAPPQSFAARFSLRRKLTVGNPKEPVQSISETTHAAVWAGFAEVLAEAASTAGPKDRLFAWLHSSGLYGPWDAPTSCYEEMIDEDDPPVEPSAMPAEAMFDDNTSPEACEARFAASCRYAGQVAVIDSCLAVLLDIVEGLFEGQPLRVVLFGLRGYPLGEHGRIGGVDQRLYGEQQHAPLLVRTAVPADRFQRVDSPTRLSDAIGSLLNGGAPPRSNPTTLASAEARAVLTTDRMARFSFQDGESPELYVKPDDRWEQNDIASLEDEVVAEMLAKHAGLQADEDSE